MLNTSFAQKSRYDADMCGSVALPLGRNKLPRSFRILLQLVMFLAACWGQSTAQVTAPDVPLSETGRAHFLAAQVAQQRRDYAAAEREYQAVLAEYPGFAELYESWPAVSASGSNSGSHGRFRSALKVKPALAGANFFLGVDYCKIGNGARAIPYSRQPRERNLDRTDIWSWLVTAQEILGDYQAEAATLKHARA